MGTDLAHNDSCQLDFSLIHRQVNQLKTSDDKRGLGTDVMRPLQSCLLSHAHLESVTWSLKGGGLHSKVLLHVVLCICFRAVDKMVL